MKDGTFGIGAAAAVPWGFDGLKVGTGGGGGGGGAGDVGDVVDCCCGATPTEPAGVVLV